MYSLGIKFKLLNKTHNREELECDSPTANINITSSDDFSIIISGFRTKEEAEKKVNEIRASKIDVPRFDKKSIPFALPDDVPEDMISVDKHNPQNTYSLNVMNLSSIEEAQKAVGKIELAFIKFMLERHQTYQACFNNPKIIGDEVPLAADNGEPLIYRTQRSRPLNTFGGEGIRIENSISSSALIAVIEEALSSNKCITDTKLKLAFDIYRSSFYDDVPSSRFLSLINILEVLAPKKEKDGNAQGLINKWENERKDCLETCLKEDQQSLKDLKNTLKFAREQSIRSSIYDFVLDELKDEEKATAAKGWYDVRSSLVHKGIFKNDKNIEIQIDDIIKDILRKKLSEL